MVRPWPDQPVWLLRLRMSLEAFHTRKLQPGKALSLFLQDLKQKLCHAMPCVTGAVREQLLPRVYNNRRGGECLTLDITRTNTLR